MTSCKGNRQAVIIIHGIGEQRPMDTLRSFVKNLFSKDIRNKPDKMSASFELRRLQVPGKGRYQPLTDFYEYYWAHHMRDTKLRHVLSWSRSLLLKRPKNVSNNLLPIYYFLWITFFPILYYFLSSVLDFLQGGSLISLTSLLIVIGFLFFDYHVLRIIYGTIDDAARYLSPSPDNIEQRNKIRKEGIELLNKLHKSKKYRRIVVVGHSLGSVIAYDLLRLYWASIEVEKRKNTKKQKLLHSFSSDSNNILSCQNYQTENERIKDYQNLQIKLWRELRESNWPWLVTDFVTIGSPLAHGSFLLANDGAEFEQLKKEGEYPCCPPVGSNKVFYKKNYRTPDNGLTTSSVPTYSAPFICTRWNNIYFPHRKIFKGDLIGGPLKNIFGRGVNDIPVGISGYFKEYLQSHTKYWSYDIDSFKDKNKNHPTQAVRDSMSLGRLKNNEMWPEP